MSDFNSEWGTATINEGEQEKSNLEPPPDGPYVAELVKGSAFTSKAKGEDWVALEFNEVTSNHAWTLLLGFRSQGQANITKTACYRLGIQVDQVGSLEELNSQLEALAGGYFEVTVKTNGEYRNTYVEGPARAPSAEPRSDVTPPAEEPAVDAGSADDDDAEPDW